MRKALNENPQIQLAVLGVVGVLFAVIMFTMVLGKDEVPPPDPAAAAIDPATGAPVGAIDPATGAPAGTVDPAATVPGTSDPAVPATPPVDVGKVKPGKGLPKPVVAAYNSDKAVVLLVIDPKGISDRAVEGYTKRLESRNDVNVFTVKAKDISRYSRITQGVSVSQAPALIVVQPKSDAKGAPLAAVSYGFRNAKSVQIALEDALYNGPTRASYPE